VAARPCRNQSSESTVRERHPADTVAFTNRERLAGGGRPKEYYCSEPAGFRKRKSISQTRRGDEAEAKGRVVSRR
jgi:hypothetical protein